MFVNRVFFSFLSCCMHLKCEINDNNNYNYNVSMQKLSHTSIRHCIVYSTPLFSINIILLLVAPNRSPETHITFSVGIMRGFEKNVFLAIVVIIVINVSHAVPLLLSFLLGIGAVARFGGSPTARAII